MPAADNGLYQPFDNTAFDDRTWEMSDAPTYRNLVDVGHILEPSTGARPPRGRKGLHALLERHTKVPWLYRPPRSDSGELGTFISYDDPASISLRVNLIRELGLRGAMIWEISQDSEAHELSRELQRLLVDRRLHGGFENSCTQRWFTMRSDMASLTDQIGGSSADLALTGVAGA